MHNKDAQRKLDVRMSLKNYQPNSVLPILNLKWSRDFVHNSFFSYLFENSLIYPKQAGFPKLETALIGITRIDKLLFNLGSDLFVAWS